MSKVMIYSTRGEMVSREIAKSCTSETRVEERARKAGWASKEAARLHTEASTKSGGRSRSTAYFSAFNSRKPVVR